MSLFEKVRPGLGRKLKEPFQSAFRKVWYFLKHVAIGPGWRLHVTDDGLFVQRYSGDDRAYMAAVRCDPDDYTIEYRDDSTVVYVLEIDIDRVVQNTLAATNTWPFVIVPCNGTITKVCFSGNTVAGNPQCDCYRWTGGADQGTVLSSTVVLAAAMTVYDGTLTHSTETVVEDDILQPRFVTGAGVTQTNITMHVEITVTTDGFGTDYDSPGE